MFLEATVLLKGAGATVLLPKGAVQEDAGQRFLFVKWGEDFFVRRFVETGAVQGDWIPTLSGVSAGDLVVVKGAFYLKSDVLKEKMGAGCAD